MAGLLPPNSDFSATEASSLDSQFASFQTDLNYTLLLELFERSPDAILVNDRQGNVVTVNHRACELLGYDRKGLIGMTAASLVASAERDRLTARNPQAERWTCLHKDGRSIPVEITTQDLTNGCCVWFIRERRDALSASDVDDDIWQFNRDGLSDFMPQFVWVCNLQGELTYVNRQWIDYSGLSLEESRDPGVMATSQHPEDQQRVADQWAIALEAKQPFEVEARLRRALDGEYRWFLIRSVPLFDNQGQLVRWFGTSTDIHDRKRAELNNQLLNELDLRLRQLSDAEAMVWEVISSLGEYLNVDRCLWHDIDWDNQLAIVGRNWRRKPLADLAGTHHLTAFFSAKQLTRFAQGQSMVVADVTTHSDTASNLQNYLPLGVAAFASVPCIQSGRWIASLSVATQTTRNWRDDEIALLQEIVARLWALIEQTRSLYALRESEERLRLALTAASQGLYDLNVQTGEAIVSPEYAQMLGYDPATFKETNAKWRERLHPDDWEPVSRTYEDYITGRREDYRVEFRQRTASGHWKWILSLGRIVAWNRDGQPLRMLGTHTDISDRKQAEAALQKRNQYIQLLYETTRDLLSTDQPLTLVETVFTKLKLLVGLDIYFNYVLDPETQQLHLKFCSGISEEMTRSIEWLDVGQAVCGTVAQQQGQIVRANLQHSTDPKTQLVRSLGLTAYACQPLVAQGKLFGTLGFGSRSRIEFTTGETKLFQAICDQIAIALERSQLMSSLQQQTEELRKINRLKDDFFSSLSHELRTPLNPILGWTKMLQGQRLPPAKAAQALETIERNVKHQINLVNDLLDVSRVIQGKLRVNSQPVDLTFILTTAIQTVEFAAQAKALTLRFNQAKPIYTMGDGDRLRQVFWNLLSNAIKFTPEGGTVEIQLSVSQEGFRRYAQVSVSDTGIGIAAEFLPHIFEYFRQAEGGSTRKYGGLGLGLAIVRHLVELHGGTIIAHSPGLGQGATFVVKLPLLSSPSPAQLANLALEHADAADAQTTDEALLPQPSSAATLTPQRKPLAGVRIVIVDDEPDNLELLRFLLNEEGAIMSAFISASDALKAIAQSPPDLIISDIGMPEMSGYEFMQRLRQLPPHQGGMVPAIAITAFAQRADRERTLATGYQTYLAKPVNPQTVIETVTQLLFPSP